jgi:two-component system, NtrC family, sensor kinase
MKKAILFFATLFTADMAFAQNVHIQDADSLRRELAVAKQDTSRAIILADLAEAYRAAKPDSTLYFADQALQLSRSINFPFGEMRAYLILCHYFQFNGIDLPKALETGLKGLDITVKHHFKDYEAGVSLRLGTVHLTLGNTQEAFNYFRRANKASSDGVHPFFHTITYYWLSTCYLRVKKPDSALYMAKIGYDKAVVLKNYFVLGGALANMGRMSAIMGNNELAKQYYRQRIAAAERISEYADIAGGYMSLAYLFRDAKQNDSAIYYAKKAYDLYRPRFFYAVNTSAKLLSTLLEPSDPAEALRYLKIAEAAKDSANNIQKMQSAQALVFKEKERQAELGYERKTYQSKVRQYALLAGIGLLSLVLVGLYRNNRIKQKANLALEMQKKKVEEMLAELKSTQVQLIQSEKMASLGELTAGIAHEIQNPLNFVNNFSEVNKELVDELRREMSNVKSEKHSEIEQVLSDLEQNLEKINHHGKRADGIVKSMLQHSRTSTGQKELTNINALCEEYVRLSYHGYRAKDKSFNAKFELDLDTSLPKINVVPQDIGRVVLNLINNAFYAVNEKSKQGANNYDPTVTISTKRLEDKISISVKDNGNGIHDSVRSKIFQPFFTTKPAGQGTGLGLSLAYDIITKRHGGTIEVSSEEGLGTEFRIKIPATPTHDTIHA